MSEPFSSESPRQREYGYYLVEEVKKGKITRRQLVARATVFGISLSTVPVLLAACGGDDEGGGGEAAPAGGTGGAETGAGTTAPAEGEPKRGGMLRVGTLVPPSTFEPVTLYDGSSAAAVQQVNEYLNRMLPGYELKPILAESWEADETAKAWTFRLRQGVTFNDGSPMTADDVVYSFDLLTDPESQSQALSNFATILSPGNVEKVDDLTVVFHLDRAYADFPYMAGQANYNAYILKRGYEIGSWSKNPIGTGPFAMTEYKPKQSATFTRRDDYWGEPPYLDGMELIFYGDTQAEALALQGGEIDAMLGSEVSLYENPDLQLIRAEGAGWNAVAMRVDMEPWTDPRVRQALAWSIDRQGVIDAVYSGFATLGNDHLWAPAYPIGPDVEQREQDLDRAKQLLADAGVPNPKVRLTAERAGETPNYAVVIKDNAEQAGFQVEVRVLDQPTWYGSGENQPWLEDVFGITGWANRPVPTQTINAAMTCKAIWNSAHFCNEEFDRVIAEYDATVEEATRVDLATQASEILHEESPYLIAYFNDTLRSAQPYVMGLEAPVGSNLDLTATWLDQ